jgi:hypothetical protein
MIHPVPFNKILAYFIPFAWQVFEVLYRSRVRIKGGCVSFFRGIVSLIEGTSEFELSPGIVLGVFRLVGLRKGDFWEVPGTPGGYFKEIAEYNHQNPLERPHAMILDRLPHASLYSAMHPLFAESFAFIAGQAGRATGRYALSGGA